MQMAAGENGRVLQSVDVTSLHPPCHTHVVLGDRDLRLQQARLFASVKLEWLCWDLFQQSNFANWLCLTQQECEVKTPFLYQPTSAMQDYPLNLSISFSGGQENNCDSLSNSE